MNKQVFIAVLVFVGVMVMFFFYNLWESENLPKQIKIQSYNPPTSHIAERKNTERTRDTKTALKKTSTHKQSAFITVKKELVSEDIPYGNPASMEAHTQNIYTTLTPDNHDESIEKADESFNQLDKHVNTISQSLDAHMKIVAMRQSFKEKELSPIEDTYEMALPAIHE